MDKTATTSFKLSPTVRQLLECGKQTLNLTKTAIVEQAVRQWAQRENVHVDATDRREGKA